MCVKDVVIWKKSSFLQLMVLEILSALDAQLGGKTLKYFYSSFMSSDWF